MTDRRRTESLAPQAKSVAHGARGGSDTSSFFAEHAITPEVADARPYIRFEKGELSKLLRLHPEFEAHPGRVRLRMGKAGGLVIIKNPLPGQPGGIIPQFRADQPFDNSGKYMMWPARRALYSHVHPIKRGDHRRHLQKHHPAGEVEGPHEHESNQPDPNISPEKRLDMHPMNWALIARAERVFFALEGAIKADALLSAGECVFDVPSVTMWNAPELPEFAKLLGNRPVFIVPDADWIENPMVSLQAFTCRDALRGAGVLAEVVTWDLETGHEGRECKRQDCVKGVDDLLARRAAGLSLLKVQRREPSEGFHVWAVEQMSKGRKDAARNDVETLRWLALHADNLGRTKKAAEPIARHLGAEPITAHRAVTRLVNAGALTVLTGDTEYEDARWRRTKRKDGSVRRKPMDFGPGWRDTPTFLIREDLRAVSVVSEMFL